MEGFEIFCWLVSFSIFILHISCLWFQRASLLMDVVILVYKYIIFLLTLLFMITEHLLYNSLSVSPLMIFISFIISFSFYFLLFSNSFSTKGNPCFIDSKKFLLLIYFFLFHSIQFHFVFNNFFFPCCLS